MTYLFYGHLVEYFVDLSHHFCSVDREPHDRQCRGSFGGENKPRNQFVFLIFRGSLLIEKIIAICD